MKFQIEIYNRKTDCKITKTIQAADVFKAVDKIAETIDSPEDWELVAAAPIE